MDFNAYHILFISIIILSALYQLVGGIKLKVRNHSCYANLIFFVTICIVLILFCGLVGDISSDHSQYIRIYNNIASMPLSSFFTWDYQISDVEKGFGLIMWLSAKLVGDPVGMFLVSAALIVIPIAILAYKTNDPCLFIILYLGFGTYYDGFNVIRQVIVGGVLILSIKYIIDGKFWKFLLVDLIFSSIHISALLMIPFYFLLRNKPGFKTTSLHCIIILLFSFGFYRILNVFDSLFFGGKYFTSGRINEGNQIIQVVVPLALFVLCECIIYSYKSNKTGLIGRFQFNNSNIKEEQKNINDLYNILWNCSFYWILFWIFSLKFAYLRRITYFFVPFIFYIITEGITGIKSRNMQWIFKFAILAVTFIYYFLFGQYFDNYVLFNQ